MAEYHLPSIMELWGSDPQTEELKGQVRLQSFCTFFLHSFCRQVVDGHLSIPIDLNGVDYDDFVWYLEGLYLTLGLQPVESSE